MLMSVNVIHRMNHNSIAQVVIAIKVMVRVSESLRNVYLRHVNVSQEFMTCKCDQLEFQ